MKYHYNSLIIGLALANSTLFPTHLDFKLTSSRPVSVITRSTCQSGINRVLSQIQAKGVSRKYVDIFVAKGEANTLNFNNPTNRTDTIYVSFGYSKKYNSYDKDSRSISKMYGILKSPNLMKTLSQIIVDNCINIAVVDFSRYGEDGLISYAIQADGTMKRRQCTEPSSNPLPWHLRGCA